IHYEQYVLAAHPDNRLARSRAPIRLAELAEDPLVWLARGEMTDRNDALMRQCQMRGLDPVVGHIARTHDEQIDVTIVSGGACITPASLMLDIHRDFLAVRPLADVDMEISLSLAWTTEMMGEPAQLTLSTLHDAIVAHQEQIRSVTTPWGSLNRSPVTGGAQ